MLGYVRAYKPELKGKEYELYRGVYCSLCRNLGRRYSPLAQLFLSYDFTLAGLLLLAMQEEKCCFTPCRCPYNPAKRCCNCKGNRLDSCADGVIITVYYKLIDNLQDKGFFKKLLCILLFLPVALMHRKAARLSPAIENAVGEAMAEQKKAEADKNCSLDKAAHPSAKALGTIFSLQHSGDDAALLYSLGYMVGRYVYILDAAEDLKEDCKRGNFNPFIAEKPRFGNAQSEKEFADKVTQMLNLTQSQALSAFHLLQPKRFGTILQNIILYGLDASATKVLSVYNNGKPKKPSEFSV